jgi:hypothetical protein
MENYFIAGSCSIDSHFPMHLWDPLIAQAALMINLLCQLRRNLGAACIVLEGNFNFNFKKTPLAPPAQK